MKKFLAFLTLAFACTLSSAAPTLSTVTPYPSTGPQPDAASFTINGGTPVACTLVSVAAGVQPQCDLAPVVAQGAGTYTLVMTVSKAGGTTNTGTNAGQTVVGSSASSGPFAYKVLTQAVPGPTLNIVP